MDHSVKHAGSSTESVILEVEHDAWNLYILRNQARIQKRGLEGGRVLRNGAFWCILEHVLDQLGL